MDKESEVRQMGVVSAAAVDEAGIVVIQGFRDYENMFLEV